MLYSETGPSWETFGILVLLLRIIMRLENESQVEEKRVSPQRMSSERKEANSQIQEKLA